MANWKQYEIDRETVTAEEYATWPWYKLPWRYFKVEICLIAITIPIAVFGFLQL